MINLLASTLVALSSFVNVANVPNYEKDLTINKNEIVVKQNSETIKNIEWRNNNTEIKSDKDSIDLFETYNINENEAKDCFTISIQDEIVPVKNGVHDETIINDYDTSHLMSTLNFGQKHSYDDSYEYLRIITKAYGIGFYDGKAVYRIEVETIQQKNFIIHRKDNLIIRHGQNSVTFYNNDHVAKGVYYKPNMNFDTNDIRAESNGTYVDLEPEYSRGDAGIKYTFWNHEVFDDEYFKRQLITIKADYYIVATNTTEVQAIYIHNINKGLESLSVSIGPIGAGINVGDHGTVVESKPLVLCGYNNDIVKSKYTVSPNEWGFEPRYYFKNEGVRTTTKTIDDFEIKTERLRCGYIEDLYVNLSANRVNAGEAYLTMYFNKPVHAFGVYFSLWSSKEFLYRGYDHAYVQYLDKNNKWVTEIDLLELDIPTYRYNQDYFDMNIVEGTYGIRIYETKETANMQWRNKGRVCLGAMSFVHYELD